VWKTKLRGRSDWESKAIRHLIYDVHDLKNSIFHHIYIYIYIYIDICRLIAIYYDCSFSKKKITLQIYTMDIYLI